MVKDELASSLARKERWSQVALEEHRLGGWKLAFHQQTPV
jgi:hypothetical protein